MEENPYEPPQGYSTDNDSVATSIREDPLRMPAYACFIGSASGGILIAAMAMGFVWNIQESYKELKSQFGMNVVTFWFGFIFWFGIFPLLCVVSWHAGYCMVHRLRRWFVIAAALLSIIPIFGGCWGAPIGIIVLFRLFQKEVWDSFDKTSTSED